MICIFPQNFLKFLVIADSPSFYVHMTEKLDCKCVSVCTKSFWQEYGSLAVHVVAHETQNVGIFCSRANLIAQETQQVAFH